MTRQSHQAGNRRDHGNSSSERTASSSGIREHVTAFVRDERGVAVPTGYALTISIAMVVMLITSGVFIGYAGTHTTAVTEAETEVIAENVAAHITAVDAAVTTNTGATDVTTLVETPPRTADGEYVINVTSDTVTVSTNTSNVASTTALRTTNPVNSPGVIRNESVVITHDSATGTITVRGEQ